jgi:hypothetical protein
MNFAEEITAEEMGIDANTFMERFDELGLFIENHAEAIVASRKAYNEWRTLWRTELRCDEPTTDTAKEVKRLKDLYDDAELEQVKTYEALQIAVMGEDAWKELKRRAEEWADQESNLVESFDRLVPA